MTTSHSAISMWAEFGLSERDTQAVNAWARSLQDSFTGAQLVPPHATLLYGFDRKDAARVASAMVIQLPLQATIKRIKWGSKSPVLLAELDSAALQDLFASLHTQVPNRHTLIDGRYDPHITLLQWPSTPSVHELSTCALPESTAALVGKSITLTAACICVDE